LPPKPSTGAGCSKTPVCNQPFKTQAIVDFSCTLGLLCSLKFQEQNIEGIKKNISGFMRCGEDA